MELMKPLIKSEEWMDIEEASGVGRVALKNRLNGHKGILKRAITSNLTSMREHTEWQTVVMCRDLGNTKKPSVTGYQYPISV